MGHRKRHHHRHDDQHVLSRRDLHPRAGGDVPRPRPERKAASAAEFSDVPTDSYFADAVAWAAANGVTEGIGGGLFGSDNDCTRGQIVTFLYRAYNK